MIVDTSAIVAILQGEEEESAFREALVAAEHAYLSAANYLELAIVTDRIGDPVLGRRLDEVLDTLDITVVDVTAEDAKTARQAARDYGRGSGHPARLNFGDCFSYALAARTGEPLLFKGDDFSRTDLRPAAPLP
ncbi:type II toxin-antitoxin system VapC family toxin [Ruania alkalisoli]|uniref:Ribonuclease VapC n=1 Tax=Ruania alkalisoli TaxID=2779775 RepID=A0A7M1SWB3_9MICO|nr:type II toxin-antitoxin system VapC family toxin [Ruania alkalisoli]QOR71848.1 type II toxin-antitoxin system VapC family toxin [Ruania alkalisoli]